MGYLSSPAALSSVRPQFAPDSPFPPQTIPAKAGISLPQSGNNRRPKPKSAHNLPYTSRPFLRRQESHNKRRQRRVESAAGGMPIVADCRIIVSRRLRNAAVGDTCL